MSNKRTISAAKEVDDYQPFGLLWLDSAYQETLLSNGPWQTMVCEIDVCIKSSIRGVVFFLRRLVS